MNITWMKAALIRALKTVCQTAVATIGTAMVVTDVNWAYVISASLLAGLLSILTSVAGLPEVDLQDTLDTYDDYDPDDEDEEEEEEGDE